MKDYSKVLIAVDLDPSSQKLLIQKALSLKESCPCDLYLVHSVEQISSYGAAYGVAAGAEIEDTLLDSAKNAMRKLAEQLNLPSDRVIIKVGPPKAIILEEAERLKVDLIIVGSHGRHGIRLLLGSTANAVLHGATCDVLAVRIKD